MLAFTNTTNSRFGTVMTAHGFGPGLLNSSVTQYTKAAAPVKFTSAFKGFLWLLG